MKKIILIFCFAGSALSLFSQTLSFSNATSSPFSIGGSQLRSNVAVDLNGDGKLDLLVADYGNNTISVLLGNGNGTFSQASGSPITVGTNPLAIAIGDFNHDGKWDLSIANYGDNTISILLGNGNGTFTQASGSPISVGSYPYWSDTADFNHDGKQDLAVVNLVDGTVSVLLGNGNGTFTPASGSPINLGASSNPYHVTTADFNNDGKLDMAITEGGTQSVAILLGNGNGTFTPASGSPISLGNYPRIIKSADLNNDGKIDLVVTESNSTTIDVLLGNGNGTFTAASGSPLNIGTGPTDIAIYDINKDSKPDIIVANSNTQVHVLYGNGNGTFTSPSGSPLSGILNDAQSIAIGDFNGDNKPDMAISSWASDSVQILLNDMPLGIASINQANDEAKIYPNPTSGIFTIECNSLQKNWVVEVYNVLGDKVYSSNINSAKTQIDLSNQAEGIYFYRAITNEANLIVEGKIIKE